FRSLSLSYRVVSEEPNGDDVAKRKYEAWASSKGQSSESAREEYVRFAEKMIQEYHRHVHRCKWNSEVWSIDY
ncbi:ACB domain-containing protein, partial [Trichostrongylus colubriformis]